MLLPKTKRHKIEKILFIYDDMIQSESLKSG